MGPRLAWQSLHQSSLARNTTIGLWLAESRGRVESLFAVAIVGRYAGWPEGTYSLGPVNHVDACEETGRNLGDTKGII